MTPYRIKIMNKIAPEGLALFGPDYSVGADVTDPDAIIVRSATVDTEQFPSLLAVARAGAGVNNITVEAATAKGVCVFNTPGANANAVAELVLTMMGMGARNIHQAIDFCRDLGSHDNAEIGKLTEEKKSLFRGFELAGKTLGVLGLGKIGVKVANNGITHRMQVYGFDPYPAIENIHQLSSNVRFVRSLNDVVSRAHILSLHMPFMEKLRHCINAELIARLPKGAILMNYARGPLVDEQAVIAALDNGHLALYITDFPSADLIRHPRVLTTPHLGASTGESEEHAGIMAVNELKSYLEHGTVTHSVNFPTAETIPTDNVHTRLIMINRDVPGMIGFASQLIGAGKINIASYLNASNGTIGYNIIDLENPMPSEILGQISAHADVIRVRIINFK